jgi:hypothetical protein
VAEGAALSRSRRQFVTVWTSRTRPPLLRNCCPRQNPPVAPARTHRQRRAEQQPRGSSAGAGRLPGQLSERRLAHRIASSQQPQGRRAMEARASTSGAAGLRKPAHIARPKPAARGRLAARAVLAREPSPPPDRTSSSRAARGQPQPQRAPQQHPQQGGSEQQRPQRSQQRNQLVKQLNRLFASPPVAEPATPPFEEPSPALGSFDGHPPSCSCSNEPEVGTALWFSFGRQVLGWSRELG